MALPWEHEMRVYSYDYNKVRVECTCSDFQLDYPDGIALSSIEEAPAIQQHREFHQHQKDEADARAALLQHPQSGARPLIAGHGTGQPGAAEYVGQDNGNESEPSTEYADDRDRHRHNVLLGVHADRMRELWSRMTPSQVAIGHVAQVLEDRAAELLAESEQAAIAQLSYKQSKTAEPPSHRSVAMLEMIATEYAILAHSLDPFYGQETARDDTSPE